MVLWAVLNVHAKTDDSKVQLDLSMKASSIAAHPVAANIYSFASLGLGH